MAFKGIQNIKDFFSNKRTRLALVLFIFLPILFINNKDSHNWGGDFAQYINQARCISEGISQSETGYIFNEQNPYLGAPAYPVGFPIILAPVYYFFGNNIFAFSIVISVFLFGLSLMLFNLNNIYFRYPLSVVLTMAFIYNPWMLRFKACILSDIPFAFFLVTSLYIYLKFFREEKKQIPKSILLGFLISFSMSVKTIGVVVLLGIYAEKIILSIKEKKIKAITFYNILVLTLSVLFCYILINFIVFPTGVEQYSFFSTLFHLENLDKVIVQSYKSYFGLIKEFFSQDIVISSLTLGLFLIGFVWKVVNKIDLVDYVFVFYLAIVFVFPVLQGFRYLMPVYPIIILYIFIVLKSILLPLKIKEGPVFALLLFFLLFWNYSNGIHNVLRHQKDTLVGPQEGYSREAFQYIRENTDRNSVLACLKPRVLALYTSRKSIGVGLVATIEEIEEKFSEVGVNYVVSNTDLKNIVLTNYINGYNNKLELIWSNEKFKVYKRKEAAQELNNLCLPKSNQTLHQNVVNN
jgi:4-amino-4-deoxy-L-arabinose transferase-like glycosyltransferase